MANGRRLAHPPPVDSVVNELLYSSLHEYLLLERSIAFLDASCFRLDEIQLHTRNAVIDWNRLL